MASPSVRSVSLTKKVAFLSEPGSYPDEPPQVDAIETHMAWVFLAGDKAYKLKKPIRRPYLDFTTVEARYHDACAEVRLNRRLAPDVYLGVAALQVAPCGTLHLHPGDDRPSGYTAVDWLVRMRRLPAEAMLDAVIRRGDLTETDVEAVARRMVSFYTNATPAPLDETDYSARYHRRLDVNLRVLRTPDYQLPSGPVQRLGDMLEQWLAQRLVVLEERAHRVVDAHGDLRPEHICLQQPPVMIDCLAFSRRLRSLDPAEELAYLAMECEQLGAPHVSQGLFDVYARETGDAPDPEVLAFYRSYQASVRAKLAIWHLDDADVAHPEHWRKQAESYVRLGLSPAPPPAAPFPVLPNAKP